MQFCSADATINRKYTFSLILCIISVVAWLPKQKSCAHQKPLNAGLGIKTGALANLPG